MVRLLALLLLLFAPLRASTDVLLAAADDATLQPLIARLANPHTETRASWTFWLGTLGGKSVVLTRTEGDPLNAVAAATLAIRRYAPKLVVSYGSARAHDPALQPGDAIVSEVFAAFDGMVSPVTSLDGGAHPLKWERLPHAPIQGKEVEKYVLTFPADATALAAAKKLSGPRGAVIPGTLGSANQVNREADRIAWIRATWGTSCEDGESAHLAGAAQLLGVPIIGLRIIEGTPEQAAALALKFMEASR
ncbi:MAG: hypothetical protein JSS11_16625 [Verrucomicrobia bacterium]|nr:hypothetical protein [Verrucomicrobiota bacterium]